MTADIVRVPLHTLRQAILAVVALGLCGCSVHRDIDINSGAVRQRSFFLGQPAITRVAESQFSREVRRLAISTPEGRIWKPMTVTNLGRVESQEYDGAIEDCDFLVAQMNTLRLSDEDRVTPLMKALSNLQTGELDQTYDLIHEMSNRMRVMMGIPPIPKQERMRRPRDENGKLIRR